MKYKFFLIALACILSVILAFYKKEKIKEILIKYIQQDGSISKYDKYGRRQGESITYFKGKVYIKEFFKNGLRHGWNKEYYDNGVLKRKTFFLFGKANGEEFIFNEKGKLLKIGHYLNDRPYGSWLRYDTSGVLDTYLLMDINQQIAFSCTYRKMDITDMHGLVVSPNFYTLNSKGKILNMNEQEIHSALDVKDLYITVANPPQTKLELLIDFNGKEYRFNKIKNNTILIVNALKKKGRYNLLLKSKLRNKENKIINGIDMNKKIIIK